MITCKEDLMNTHIENDFGELRKAYIDKAIELGYDHQGNRERGLNWYNLPFIAINSRWNETYVAQVDETSQVIAPTKSKLLTLKDLEKPKSTKFVKVEESIFDLKGEFERGELYSSDCEGCYTQLKHKKSLYLAAHQDAVYRKVEIDWRDEVKETYDAVELPVGERGKLYMGEKWDEQEFIKFCHLVASLTEKPEGI